MVDKANYFNSEEVSAINRSCKAFEQNHDITLFIYTYNSEETHPSFPRSTPNFNKFVFVKIDIRTNQVRTSVINLNVKSAGIVERFFLQWCQENIAEKGIYNSLEMAVNEYDHYLERKKEVESALKAQRENEKNLLPLTSSTIQILIVIIIWFIISFTKRSLKPGDKFENSEFYGLSRLGFSGVIYFGYCNYCIHLSSVWKGLDGNYVFTWFCHVSTSCDFWIFCLYPVRSL